MEVTLAENFDDFAIRLADTGNERPDALAVALAKARAVRKATGLAALAECTCVRVEAQKRRRRGKVKTGHRTALPAVSAVLD